MLVLQVFLVHTPYDVYGRLGKLIKCIIMVSRVNASKIWKFAPSENIPFYSIFCLIHHYITSSMCAVYQFNINSFPSLTTDLQSTIWTTCLSGLSVFMLYHAYSVCCTHPVLMMVCTAVETKWPVQNFWWHKADAILI